MNRTRAADAGCLALAGAAILALVSVIWVGNQDTGYGPVEATGVPGSAPVSPIALSAAGYQRALTELDVAARAPTDRVLTAKTSADLRAAKSGLGALLEDRTRSLGELVPPPEIVQEHRNLREGLAAEGRWLTSPDPVPTAVGTDSCGIKVPERPIAELVYDTVDRLANKDSALRKAIAALAAKKFVVGGFLPAAPETPAPPPAPPTSRPPNGKIVERSGPRGQRRLQIANDDSSDVAVSVVNGEPSKPQVMIYVHAGASATITGISGDYRVYFKTGSGWDAAGRRFTSGCSFEKFEQTFDQGRDWSIGLRKSSVGNARTGEVPAY
ncbi:hypothetical protein [Amycolatopsis pittospori]|uniref:hypothetical protein n=1 Tax=Amycolatopsis pittospori TaxID=2749434 RepID=UPI0015F10A3D|nr:hypothetical protein [Amycolatopsis pittospori]